ncbi:MAG: alpha,6-mannosyltransferase [Solirubrobacteraceae bacterium]|nr:alpha,6-mannosyltransferase [Solirubrobacteraceae bacterium]
MPSASQASLPSVLRLRGTSAGGAAALARLTGAWPGRVALAGAVVASSMLAAGASSRRLLFFVPASLSGFPEWMRGPLSELDLALTPLSGSLLVLVLCGCYALALVNARSLGLRWVLGAIGCAHVAFMLAAPLYSADIFGYVDYARLAVLHGIDPYAHGAAAAPHDEVHRYVRWRDVGSPYGPLFTIASYPLAWLDVPTAFWALKAGACAASLGCVALVARIARQLGRPVVPAVLFVGLNPLLLAYGVGGGHNDFFAVLVMLAGVTLALGARDGRAGATFVLAAGLKAPAGLALPFLLVAHRSRRGFGAAAAAAAGIAALALLTFGSGALGVVRQIAHQQSLVASLSVPSLVADALGLDGVTPAVRTVDGLIAAAGLALLLWRTWRGMDWLRATGWATLLLLTTSAWLVPWYVVWLLPFAAVAGDARLRNATLAFTAFLVLTRVSPYLV